MSLLPKALGNNGGSGPDSGTQSQPPPLSRLLLGNEKNSPGSRMFPFFKLLKGMACNTGQLQNYAVDFGRGPKRGRPKGGFTDFVYTYVCNWPNLALLGLTWLNLAKLG